VSPDLSLTQEIVAACPDMTELAVWVNSNGTDASATTTLFLRDPTGERDVIVHTFRNGEISQHGWLTLHFEPQPSSQGKLYLLKLAGSSHQGIRVGYSEKAEYLDGRLFENELPSSHDILFRYGCLAGLPQLVGGIR
jgi:hypothetical protein